MISYTPFTINIKGRLTTFDTPAVMGIINVTSDSFFEGSRATEESLVREKTSDMLKQGVDIIDLGACSTRPGSESVPTETEIKNIIMGIRAIRSIDAHIPISVDTYRSIVAKAAIEAGADIINDISGGDLDPDMFDTVANLHVPYILMHMRGVPATMNSLTDYGERGVTATVLDCLGEKLNRLALKGVADVIIDPGFGFAKTLGQNYELLRNLAVFKELGCPVLAGMSRKSMATKLLGIDATEALEATVALNCFALDRGASILRVHDVRPAREAVKIYSEIYRIGLNV